MENPQEILIEAVPWSAEAGEILSEVGNAAQYAAQVKAGGVLFRVSFEDRLLGFCLLRVDGAEGVIVAGVSLSAKFDLCAAVLPALEKSFVGCHSVRVHTSRPGLCKKLTAVGYGAAEIVMRKSL